VVYGAAAGDDRLVHPRIAVLQPAEVYEAGHWRYEGTVALDRAGSFGYTVRILPRNAYLASTAEMNLVALPHAPGGITEGVLR